MQLVAQGAQDMALTGKPEVSFFKVAVRRHTNFATEAIEQTFNGTAALGNRVTCTISRHGDLITNMWLEVDFNKKSEVVNSLGHALIEYVELEIGGQRIDKHYGEFMEIWSELTMPEEKRAGFKEMIGRRDSGSSTDMESSKLYIPLQFFFSRNPGLALPLIALQYHEVKVNIQFRPQAQLDLASTKTLAMTNARLFVDYVYLDSEERKRFAQSSHEYLIEQIQHTGPEITRTPNFRLSMNHPVKALYWVVRRNGAAEPLHFGPEMSAMDMGNVAGGTWTSPEGDAFSSAKLQLNGHDRFTERDASYFRLVQPYQHHTRVPNKYVYMYSFALSPESHQPSGSANFSRLDNVTLTLNNINQHAGPDAELLVYALSINTLRLQSGMGGLSYSN